MYSDKEYIKIVELKSKILEIERRICGLKTDYTTEMIVHENKAKFKMISREWYREMGGKHRYFRAFKKISVQT
jgi:hypothetical protein